ncbi:MAG: hypothetical protein L0Z73_06185 [Gammaproteobacteria bacterium]|nr:hypothetical protein [Gammaproteobacteria bacterium]
MLSKAIQFIAHRPAFPAAIIITACVISVSALAGAPKPDIPKGKGDRCVEDTDYMRKNHMELLLHQRDETMYRGIRTKKHSLKECIDCHAVNDNTGQPVSHLDSKHFCVQCHEYASVKIDCFDCHASKPRAQQAGQRL